VHRNRCGRNGKSRFGSSRTRIFQIEAQLFHTARNVAVVRWLAHLVGTRVIHVASLLLGDIAGLVVLVEDISEGLRCFLAGQKITNFKPTTVRVLLHKPTPGTVQADLLNDITQDLGFVELRTSLAVLTQHAYDTGSKSTISNVSVALLASPANHVIIRRLEVLWQQRHALSRAVASSLYRSYVHNSCLDHVHIGVNASFLFLPAFAYSSRRRACSDD
jgi:hypothetical protein